MSAPIPLSQHLQQMRLRMNEFQVLYNKLLRRMLNHPAEAYQRFKAIQDQVDAMDRDHEAWASVYFADLREVFGTDSEQEKQACHYYTGVQEWIFQDKAYTIYALGQAAMLLGNLDEAQQLYERSWDMFGRTFIEHPLASLDEQLRRQKTMLPFDLGLIFTLKNALEDAKRYYKQAQQEGVASGFWDIGAQALAMFAHCALLQGKREEWSQSLAQAIAMAQTYHLKLVEQLQAWQHDVESMTDWTGYFQQWQQTMSEKAIIEGPDSSLNTLLLTLPHLVKIGFSDEAETFLKQAKELARGKPTQELQLLWGEASFYEGRGDINKAIKLSEEAVRKSQKMALPQLNRRSSWVNLINRRLASHDAKQRRQADQEIEKLAEESKDDFLAAVLLARASTYLHGINPDAANPTQQQVASALKALEDIEQAEACNVEWQARCTLYSAKIGIFKVLRRDEDGLNTTKQAVAYIQQSIPTVDLSPRHWGDLVQTLEMLYTHITSLLLRASPPRVREAFEWADEAKSQILRHQLAWANQGKNDTPPLLEHVSYAELHDLLSQESAALALFNVGPKYSWVFVVDPREPEPQYFQIQLSLNELQRILPEKQSLDTAKDTLFKAIPELSQKLLPPLRKAVERNTLLYLVPGSLLYTIPFAALQFGVDDYLIQHCALVSIPSAAMLKWCFSRRSNLPERSCLIFGAGETQAGKQIVKFADQAKVVKELAWVSAEMMPETTTTEQLLNEAAHFSIVHLECHGYLNTELDAPHASYLEFADKVEMAAQDLLEKPNKLNTDLVFLNACLSGTFELNLKNEVGGFWQAFFVAGTASLIATLFSVNPYRASQLARTFYDTWLKGGITKGHALQRAQCAMIEAGVELDGWATHILIGDYR